LEVYPFYYYLFIIEKKHKIMLNKTFYSNGKLLITAEYLVLDGAKSLAIPTKFDQNLIVEKIDQPKIIWQSFDINNNIWFDCVFDLPNLDVVDSNHDKLISTTLQKILLKAKEINPKFLSNKTGFLIKTNLSFPRNWGLGTSSTLINNISKWAKINAFELLNNSFGGSGYDIACAQNKNPITYQLIDAKPKITPVVFNPIFKNHLYFVYLNKKQSSKEAIHNYNKNKNLVFALAEEISQITNAIIHTKSLTEFNKLLIEHENIITSIIKQKPVQEKLFSDYFGQTKSLGAWGGDFILATGNKNSPKYFKNKGFETIIPYQDMIL